MQTSQSRCPRMADEDGILVSKFRFSLASLVGVVCASAVVLGAWRYDAKLGGIVVAALTMFAVASATVAGVLGSEATRRRWLPFAIFA